MRALPELLLLCCGLSSVGCGALSARSAAVPDFSLAHDAALLPARTRRLSNLEVEHSVTALTGLDASFATELPPDVRQEGYTPNVNQDVSSTWAARYSTLVAALAARATRASPASSACRELSEPACRAQTVRELGLRAFRRPLVT
jgi:hypothetical protein